MVRCMSALMMVLISALRDCSRDSDRHTPLGQVDAADVRSEGLHDCRAVVDALLEGKRGCTVIRSRLLSWEKTP